MELPHIEKLYRQLKEAGFGLITVTHDSSSSVARMVQYNGITHPIVSDVESAAQVFERYRAYDGKHYLIDSTGTIVKAYSKLGISIPILKQDLMRFGVDTVAAKSQ